MSPIRCEPSAWARVLALFIGLAGALVCRSPFPLLVGWTILTALAVVSGFFRTYVRFVLVVIAPIALALLLVWGWVVGAPPGAPLRSNPQGGSAFAILTSLRLATLIGITQFAVLTIPLEGLTSFLRELGLRRELLAIGVGSATLIPELRQRADQVIMARRARGLMATSGTPAMVIQLGVLLRPLLAWVLRAAVARAEMWDQRDLLERIVRGVAVKRSNRGVWSALWISGASAWLVFTLSWGS